MANGNRIDKSTMIPLALVVTIVMAFSGGAVWINSTLQALKYEISSLRSEVESFRSLVDNSWTEDDMHHWVNLLRAQNPNLNIPKVND